MADEIDDAQTVNELHQEVSLAEARAKTAPETHPDFDGKHCVECGEEIPPGRLALGKVRCVECQTVIEKKAKQFAKSADRVEHSFYTWPLNQNGSNPLDDRQ